MKRNIARTLILAGLAAGLLAYSPTISAETCSITFDYPTGIADVLDSAKLTFSYPGTYDFVTGIQKLCPNLTTRADSRLHHPECTNYEQLCGAAWWDSHVFVWDQYHTHYHLMFENPAIDGRCFVDGGFGRKLPNGQCDSKAPAWFLEPRYAVSMGSNAWWEIGVHQPSTNGLRVFNLDSISVGSVPIQLWFRKTDGSVWGWSNLGANTNWSLGRSANDIVMA